MTLLMAPYALEDLFQEDPKQYILEAAEKNRLTWLLLFADDGVTWGRIEQGSLALLEHVPGVFTKPSLAKWQQLYLFGEGGQILFWKDAEGFKASMIRDEGFPEMDADGDPLYLEEEYSLWGSAVERESETEEGSLLLEKDRGFALHLPLALKPKQQAHLVVRHYTAQDAEGQLYIAASRLVDLVEGGMEE